MENKKVVKPAENGNQKSGDSSRYMELKKVD